MEHAISRLGSRVLDYDNDGWADILVCNGHVYPEVRESALESGYRERKVVYHNLGNRTFEDVSLRMGPGITEPLLRGAAHSVISITTAISMSWSIA